MRWLLLGVTACLLPMTGCSSLPHCPCDKASDGPKTLLAWEVGPKKAEEDDKKSGAKEGEKNGTPQDAKAADKSEEKSSHKDTKNGNGKAEEPEEPKELAADRPDFTEASTTVGLGRIQFESGYTYSRNKDLGISSAHSYPEALLRIGMFAEWFELRLGQNYSNERGRNSDNTSFSTGGLEDLYVGTKLAMTEQKGYMPEVAVILFATVPTGREGISAERVLPGMAYQYGWELVKDHLSLAMGSVIATAVDETGHGYLELAQSASLGYTLTDRLGAFTEVYGFFPHGANAPGVTPQYYFDAGFTYKFTPDFQYDVRAGVGLNRHSDDYFLGTGFVVRY